MPRSRMLSCKQAAHDNGETGRGGRSAGGRSLTGPNPFVNVMSSPCRGTRLAVLAAILVSLVGCDQATKVYAVKNLKGQPQQSFLGDTVRIHYVENPGAFLGLMGGLDPRVRFWTLTVANAAVMLWVGGFLLLNRRVDRWMF